jgi:hypothetical protein
MAVTLKFTILSAAASLCLNLVSSSPTKVVDLGYAAYSSDLVLDQGVTTFFGIRFADPPNGLRSVLLAFLRIC